LHGTGGCNSSSDFRVRRILTNSQLVCTFEENVDAAKFAGTSGLCWGLVAVRQGLDWHRQCVARVTRMSVYVSPCCGHVNLGDVAEPEFLSRSFLSRPTPLLPCSERLGDRYD